MIASIEVDEVILQHRFGMSHVSIDSLSDQSRRLLLGSAQWRAHVSAAPNEGKITTFVAESAPEPIHATQAA